MPEAGRLPWGRRLLWGVFLALFVGGGCLPAPPQRLPPTPTASPSPQASATPTVVWFPPTPTRTPRPTEAHTPTPPAPPGLPHGTLILRDTFTAESSLWLSSPPPGGRLTLEGGELTITARQPRAYGFSVRSQPLLRDFALQVEASANLCQGMDEYGLIVRYAPPNNFYRFALSCDGQTRLDRLYRGTATSPRTWSLSGQAPRGAPGSVTLGVHAAGQELSFYLNGILQFTIRDPFPAAGQIGVFARSSEGAPLSISFRNLQMWEVEDAP